MKKEARHFIFDWFNALIAPVIAATLILGSLVWASPTSTSEEVQVARLYLKALANNKLDLAKDTAISTRCSIQRRKQIQKQLQFFCETRLDADDVFSLQATKIEGDFAAVLLLSKNSRMPLEPRVNAIALLRRQNKWMAAPLPGSFANTGYGYDSTVEKTVRSLELWMTSHKIIHESNAREAAKNSFLKSVSEEEKKATLDALNPQQAVLNFIQQSRNHNLFGVLASLGTASDELEDTTETTVTIVSNGLNHKQLQNKWSLVTHPSMIVLPMEKDKDKDKKRNELAFGFWNPLSPPAEQILYFPIHQTKNKTFVRLPNTLKSPTLPGNTRRRQQAHDDENELKKQLAAAIYKNNPQHQAPDNAQELLNHFTKAVNAQDFLDCFQLLPRQDKFFSDQKNHHAILTQLSALWRNIYHSKANTQNNLTLLEDEKLALLPLLYTKANNPGEIQTIRVWFIKENDGWHLVPEPTLNDYADADLRKSMQQLKTRMRSAAKERKEQHSRALMEQVVTITPPITRQAVDNNSAKKTLLKFRALLRSSNTESALAQCAVLKGTSSTQTLKNLNYAIRGATDHSKDDHILGIYRAGKWLGISMRAESKTTKAFDYPLYLIVNTEKGPRILLDIDLRHATNKGRKLINNRNFNKLEKALPLNERTDILTIFTKHDLAATKDTQSKAQLKE